MKRNKANNKKKRNFGIAAVVSSAVVVAIAVFVVLLCYKIPWSYDMTIQRLFTLSEQSVAVLKNLNEEVRIAGVYPAGQENPMVQSLLKEYAKGSDKIDVEYIDAEQEPAKLAGYHLNVAAVPNDCIVIASGSRSKIINGATLFETLAEGSVFNGEREITGAIRYLATEKRPVVYFILGNGETDPSAKLTKAAAALQQAALEVRTLSLTEGNAIPDDAALLIFASPKSDITEDELAKLNAYMRKGGSIFLMIDAMMNSNEMVYANLDRLTKGFGIGITNNYVVEQDSRHYLSTYNLYLIPLFGEHEITKQLADQNKMVILPVVRALGTVDYDKSEIANTVLLQSSEKSWIRADMTITDPNRTAEDYAGPAPLAYASVKSNIQWGEDSAHLVVIGNSSFALDGNIEAQANRDFFMDCALWLVGDHEQDVIASKAVNSGAIVIRGSEFTGLAIVSIAVLPGLAFLAAFLVWITRRNR